MTKPGYDWALKEGKTLQTKSVRKIIASARALGRREHTILATCYNCALLVSQVIHLRAQDLDFKNSTLSIPSGRLSGRMGRVPAYPIPSALAAFLKKWIQSRKLKPWNWLFKGRSATCRFNDIGCKGGHISKRDAQRIFKRACLASGTQLFGKGIHALRHARLVEVATKTKDPWFVKEVGRLASVLTALSYTRYVDVHKALRSAGGVA